MVQSLDRPSLGQALDARAQAAGLCLPVLAQVNIGGEPQKAGIAPDEVKGFVRAMAKLAGLRVSGLMAVMPLVDDPETIRPLFRRMRGLFEGLRDEAIADTRITELSMGMSGDWKIAAQEGATILRIGSAIFGKRAPLA